MLVSTVASEGDAAQGRRAGRYAARHTLWSESLPGSRLRNCGRAPRSNGVGVQIKVTTGDGGARHAGFGNLQHCGMAWTCAVCSAVINSNRQNDISAALSAWYGGGGPEQFGRVALLTTTMRHNKGHSLVALWDALSGAWNLVASGRGWGDDQLVHGERYVKMVVKSSGPRPRPLVPKLCGRIPVIRVVEVTYGEKGWHVHIHALLLLPMTATDDSVRRLGSRIWGRWLGGLEDRGLDCDRAHGVDIRLIKGDPSAALGEYFTKATYSASFEVARSDMKHANMGNRTPFGVLADIVSNGDADDLDTWHEFERGSKGRRQITWSHGLRQRLLPDQPAIELTDQELVDQDLDGEAVVELNADLWAVIVARRADWRLLAAFELSDADGYALLWQLADAAQVQGAAEWARLLRESDPNRHRWQKQDRA